MEYYTEIYISPMLLDRITAYASGTYPLECCGMLLGKTDSSGRVIISDIRNVQNRAKSFAGAYFEIDPLKVYQAEQECKEKGTDIVGFYHSHPDKMAILSEKDKKGMVPGMLYMILSVTGLGCIETNAFVLEFQGEIRTVKIIRLQ